MDHATLILLGTAATVGFVHTLVGVDHSLPFVVLARSQNWPLRKLWLVTAACGAAHILSSVLIGTIGIAVGAALGELTWMEQFRGGLAARLLIGLGLAYMIWGFYRALRGKRHEHAHAHTDGTVHVHEHDHHGEHLHVHGSNRMRALTLVGLTLVFVLGPCEALVPMLLAPAFERSWFTVAGVCAVFGSATLVTMLALVTLGHLGLRFRASETLERHMHAMAGFAIAASGLMIELLGV
ncbi:MAG TPA: sulfite exporter TauE/SafE family protein [Polyangiaceae bacterium]|nr:sulfite exporter TauE/SafE family protein [Polyangiaceae bacterium]